MARKKKANEEWLRYPWIVSYLKWSGSYPYYITMQVKEAIRDSAPLTAVTKRPDGSWATWDDLADQLKIIVYEGVAKFLEENGINFHEKKG